jgi:hypothetical protein
VKTLRVEWFCVAYKLTSTADSPCLAEQYYKTPRSPPTHYRVVSRTSRRRQGVGVVTRIQIKIPNRTFSTLECRFNSYSVGSHSSIKKNIKFREGAAWLACESSLSSAYYQEWRHRPPPDTYIIKKGLYIFTGRPLVPRARLLLIYEITNWECCAKTFPILKWRANWKTN